MSKKLTKAQFGVLVNSMSQALDAQTHFAEDAGQELRRTKAVAASASQVLNLALQEPKDSGMTKHLVHVVAVALGTIEE